MLTKIDILNAKILIIDDQEENISVLTTLLNSEGYINIQTATDPREGIIIYKNIHPDLLLLDINMPFMDGYEVMLKVKEMEKDQYCPILILTSSLDQDTRLKALQNGAKDFLPKPFEKTEALARIYNLIEVRLLYNMLTIHNFELETKVQERTRELKESQLELIHRLARAVEYRDKFTGTHVLRVSSIAMLLGKKIGLTEQEYLLIGNAAALHDIGKLGIPDSILLKPGNLKDNELFIMRKHTIFGADLLENGKSDIIKTACSIALTHHEKWDGTGYPKGLKGDAIPIEGRICAIADVYDALISERLYKKANSAFEALNEIRKDSGIAFDPALVEAFFDIIPEITKLNIQT